MSDRPDVMEDLRRQFVAAAEREIGRPRRFRRRTLALALAGLLSVGVVAEAVHLVATGDPVPSSPPSAKRFGVPALGGTVAVTATDPDRSLPFAVITYRKGGRPCAVPGQLRGNELGELRDGLFRSYEGRRGGACGDLKSAPFFYGKVEVDGRTLVFGRARADVRRVEIRAGDATARVQTGEGGAFLAVFDDPSGFPTVRAAPD